MITSYLAWKIAGRAFGSAGSLDNWLAVPLVPAANLTKAGGNFGDLSGYVPPTAVSVELEWTYYSGTPPYVRSNGFSFLNQTIEPPIAWQIGYIAVFLGVELALYLGVSVTIPVGETIGVPNGVVFSLSSPGG